ncbi:hypothetical protein FOL47_003015 [Perkinsus chesapeaki]|uniref:Mei2-like C-terminal RNA recognition motif domain-containing protein n=1 Tax=Perkinsus chesapeaki TaxID=330153 RepID=A0A7J6MZZ3_PERCH|nr:hypothetical protein FOL47_003015 [Perkinsus chesapeaki]
MNHIDNFKGSTGGISEEPNRSTFIFKSTSGRQLATEPERRPSTPPSPGGPFGHYLLDDSGAVGAFLSTSTDTDSGGGGGGHIGCIYSGQLDDESYIAAGSSPPPPLYAASSFPSLPMPLNLIEALVDIGIQEAGSPLPSRASLELLSNAALIAARASVNEGVAAASQECATRALTRMLERFAIIWEDYCKELEAAGIGAGGLEHLSSSTTTTTTSPTKDNYYYDSNGFDSTTLGPLTATTAEPPTPEGSPQGTTPETVLRRPSGFSRSSSMSNNSLSGPGGSPTATAAAVPVNGATPFNTLPQHLVDPKDWCTVILRNIPNKYDEVMLLEQFLAAGFSSDTDIRYVYTPKDATNNCNLGYAFVDLVSHDVAVKFTSVYEGFRLPSSKSRKVCSASWAKMQSVPATMQGNQSNRVGAMSTAGRRDSRFLSGHSGRKGSISAATPRRYAKRADASPPGFTTDRTGVDSDAVILLVGITCSRGKLTETLSSRFGQVASVDGSGRYCRVAFSSTAGARRAKDAILSGAVTIDGQILKLGEGVSFDKGNLGEFEDDNNDDLDQFNVGPLDDYLTQ